VFILQEKRKRPEIINTRINVQKTICFAFTVPSSLWNKSKFFFDDALYLISSDLTEFTQSF
jgi:hypothetical protein